MQVLCSFGTGNPKLSLGVNVIFDCACLSVCQRCDEVATSQGALYSNQWIMDGWERQAVGKWHHLDSGFWERTLTS